MNETLDRYYLKIDMVDYGEDLAKFDIRLDPAEKCLEIFEKILAYYSDINLGFEFGKLDIFRNKKRTNNCWFWKKIWNLDFEFELVWI